MTSSRLAMVAQLKGFLDELPALRHRGYNNEQAIELWCAKVQDYLRLYLGDTHDYCTRFRDASPREVMVRIRGVPTTDEIAIRLRAKETALRSVIQALEFETVGALTSPSVTARGSERPKVFISHGGETVARLRLQNFLWSKGMEPIVVEEKEKEGRNPDKNVDHWLQQSDFAVVLAEQSRSSKQDESTFPRANVTDEIARIRGRQKPFLVLLEKGMSLPSNQLTGLTYETFPTDHIEASFTKIERELRAAKLLV